MAADVDSIYALGHKSRPSGVLPRWIVEPGAYQKPLSVRETGRDRPNFDRRGLDEHPKLGRSHSISDLLTKA